MERKSLTADKIVVNKILMIRDRKVILDRDLAELYGVETKQLKRQVKRNLERFPDDFMFELNEEELKNWRSQIGTSIEGNKMGLHYFPYAFTEQGIAMLSSVLKSKKAIEVSIQIIRIFTKMREMLLNHKDILLKIEKLERETLQNTADIQIVFNYIKKMLIPQEQMNRTRIGFKRYDEET